MASSAAYVAPLRRAVRLRCARVPSVRCPECTHEAFGDTHHVEAAEGGGLALSKTGDRVRFDLGKGTADILVPWDELTERARQLVSEGGYQMPASQTPWQQYFRDLTTGLDKGMTLRDAPSYRDVARKNRPRDSH